MKLILKFVFSLLAVFCLITACDDSEDNAISGFKIGTSEITLGADGGAEIVKVTSGTKWVAKVNQPWVKVVPANGIGCVECEIVVDTTLSNDVRSAVISFNPIDQAGLEVQVHQTGFGKTIGLSEHEVEVPNMGQYGKRSFEIAVTANVDFTVSIPFEAQSWISLDKMPEVSLDYGARPQTTKLVFNWEMNTDPSDRNAMVSFIPKNPDDVLQQEVVLNVNQLAAPKIEDSRAGDSLAIMIIKEKLNAMANWDLSEKIDYWDGITLWEKTDKGVLPEWVGRVRSVNMRMFNTKESLPLELGKLKYLETLVLYGNTNRHLLPDHLVMGPALAQLEHLKRLSINSYGLTSINPSTELTRPKETLESLSLHGNNFTSLPYTISSYNFPNLIALDLGGMRRYDTKKDLRDDVWQTNWGMRIDASSLMNLLKWDNLKYLHLSYGYIQGELPDMKTWNTRYYTAEQIAANDTLNSASDENKEKLMTQIPCVLPNVEEFSINLNFLSGKLPDWLLYHPRLNRFFPYVLVFNQEDGYDRDGNVPKFTNVPDNLDYFYEFFPAAKPQIIE